MPIASTGIVPQKRENYYQSYRYKASNSFAETTEVWQSKWVLWSVSLRLPTKAAAGKDLAVKLEIYSLVPAAWVFKSLLISRKARDGGEAGARCVRWCQLAPVLPFTQTACEVRSVTSHGPVHLGSDHFLLWTFTCAQSPTLTAGVFS